MANKPKPSTRFLEELREIGPQKGESLLTFEARLAYMARARELWVERTAQLGGVREAADSLRVSRTNIGNMLAVCGLDRDVLAVLSAQWLEQKTRQQEQQRLAGPLPPLPSARPPEAPAATGLPASRPPAPAEKE